MQIHIPEYALYVITRLEQAGYQAFVVGGCVRDSILGAEPADWDIASSALPVETIRCFSREHTVIETGLQHGTVTVMVEGNPCEITTYRTDGTYSDGRRPDRVLFVTNLTEDLARRDFTINAMAYHPRHGLQDPFHGREDLKQRRIACVGAPDKRFDEDGLRILRAVRFASTLGFSIAPETVAAMRRKLARLDNVAAERVRVELDKALCGPAVATVFRDHVEVLRYVLPEIGSSVGFIQNNRYHDRDVWQHTLGAVAAAPRDPVIRLALLLHDLAKPACYRVDDKGEGHFYDHPQQGAAMAREITRRLRYPGETCRLVEALVFHHDVELHPDTRSVRRWLGRLGEDTFRGLLAVKRADAAAHAAWCVPETLCGLDEVEAVLETVLEQQLCFQLKDLAVNGKDLIARGIGDGPVLGNILRRLLELVVDEQLENNRDTLLEMADRLWQEGEHREGS